MYIYNVTVKIDLSVHDQWLEWMKNIHIPEVMACHCFEDNKIYKIMVDDTDGVNYSIQYTYRNPAQLEEYQAKFAPALQEKHNTKFKGQFVAFRTILKREA